MNDPERHTPEPHERRPARDAEQGVAPQRPLTDSEARHEREAMKTVGPPATAAAGAIAGGAAGMAVPAFGPIGAIVGAIVGALGGAAIGTAASQAVPGDLYTAADDARYRSLWEARADRPADQGFDAARIAYQYGHIAASREEFAGANFRDIEPELRRRWPNELRQRAGDWDAVRPYVEEGYSTARSHGAGQHRDPTVIGSAGSAVDPVEVARNHAGKSSTPDPRRP